MGFLIIPKLFFYCNIGRERKLKGGGVKLWTIRYLCIACYFTNLGLQNTVHVFRFSSHECWFCGTLSSCFREYSGCLWAFNVISIVTHMWLPAPSYTRLRKRCLAWWMPTDEKGRSHHLPNFGTRNTFAMKCYHRNFKTEVIQISKQRCIV